MPAKDDFEALSALADRLKLEDKERDGFINSSMQRLGYRPTVAWNEADDNGDEGGGDFFSGKRQQREQRRVNDDGGRQRRGGSSDWQYGG